MPVTAPGFFGADVFQRALWTRATQMQRGAGHDDLPLYPSRVGMLLPTVPLWAGRKRPDFFNRQLIARNVCHGGRDRGGVNTVRLELRCRRK